MDRLTSGNDGISRALRQPESRDREVGREESIIRLSAVASYLQEASGSLPTTQEGLEIVLETKGNCEPHMLLPSPLRGRKGEGSWERSATYSPPPCGEELEVGVGRPGEREGVE